MLFRHGLGDGYSLALRGPDTVEAVHALVLRNLERLRAWEPWAHAEQTLEGERVWSEFAGQRYAAGRAVPGVILHGDEVIGSAGLTIERDGTRGEIGYWIDGGWEGRGAVTRAAAALVADATARGLASLEVRTSVGNERSRRVAERLGFSLAEVRPQAHRVGRRLDDLAVYRLAL